ncbi:MAG: succinylglutamate desuccinylase/aspartoacylase family protein [Aquabacterium sp.]|uniref:M14 family metallopeptidase n=1 Tax=Aquabacterium sp. TaxID=1872578 RepID=UPI0025BFF86D|nr:M14 family metallopeptidase [Aquabacterium sp.]MBI3382102.1 succinylglutamate desuccinylase/aspartoacylase family protein [Aquabacterium sp.]
MKLTRLTALPDGFLDATARDLHQLIDGPTLIHLPGRRTPELFVSVLLHGNEDVGLVAIQQVLKAHAGRELPRAMSLFIGNVSAAQTGMRRLDTQPDYNRIWPGTVVHAGTPEAAIAREVQAIMLQRGLFASIDIHNNTGLNPHYSVVSQLDAATLHLALLLTRTVVWFRGPQGSQTAAFAPLCPSVAVECGKPGHPANEAAAARFIEACLHLAAFPEHGVREPDIDLYHTVALVKVAPDVDFGFGTPQRPLNLKAQLDHLNFVELNAGAAFGDTALAMPLDVRDEAGQDVAHTFFDTGDGTLRLKRPAMPAMLTLDEQVVRQDCLCYLMERVPFATVQQADRSSVAAKP